jgi:hypothetical protein
MLSLVLALTVAAPNPRLNYERKCLYCHSEEITEARRFTEGQWRRLIESMRLKAPLLISRSDVPALTQFMVSTLKLGVSARTAPTAAPSVTPTPNPDAKWVLPTPMPFPTIDVEATVDAVPDPLLEEKAQALVVQRCSKCHTLGRVYGRLDTLERSMSTLERMRLKTGSGITDDDMRVLSDYLRAQF